MPQTRVGVVGAGYIASRHVATLSALADVRVAAVSDPLAERADALATVAGARAYESHAQMLDCEPLDAVYVCVPPFAHGPVEHDVLDRGLPLFVEKPLALDVATAEDIQRRIAETGVVAATGYHWRYFDTVEQAQRLLADRPPHLLLGAWLDTTPGAPWWSRHELSGGQLVEQATHLFDLCRLLAGEVVELHAVGGYAPGPAEAVQPAATVLLRFASGAVGTVSSTCVLRRDWRIGLEVMAPGLALSLTRDALVVDDGAEHLNVPVSVDARLRADADFVAAVRGEHVVPRVPYAEALATHRLAVAAGRSARTRQAVGAGG